MRVTFIDFFPDPDDEDVLRRAVTVVADRLTFEGDHVVLWQAGAEVGRFPQETISTIGVETSPRTARFQDPEELRKRYPNAYKPWTPADDERLLSLYKGGEHDHAVLATEFGRQPSAIRSRLEKHGLEHLKG